MISGGTLDIHELRATAIIAVALFFVICPFNNTSLSPVRAEYRRARLDLRHCLQGGRSSDDQRGKSFNASVDYGIAVQALVDQER